MFRFKGQFVQNGSVYLIEFLIRFSFQNGCEFTFRNGRLADFDSCSVQSLSKSLLDLLLVVRVKARKHAIEVNHAAAVWATAAAMKTVILSFG